MSNRKVILIRHSDEFHHLILDRSVCMDLGISVKLAKGMFRFSRVINTG